MILRRFLPEDIQEIVALFRETVHRVNARDYSPAQIAAWAPENIDTAALAQRLQNSFSLVAEEEGMILGFGNLEASGHIDCLYTRAGFLGRGIGSALLRELEREARQNHATRLFTEASLTALSFFEQHGFLLLEPQTVAVRGVILENYRMEKAL